MLNNLSKRFGPDFVQKWIYKIHQQDSKDYAINIGADISYEHRHYPGAGAINKHGNEVDR